MNKLRRLPSALYIIVLKSLRLQASTRIRFRSVLKSFHSGDRFQTFAATVCVFIGYVWTQGRNKMFAHKNESGYAWTRRKVLWSNKMPQFQSFRYFCKGQIKSPEYLNVTAISSLILATTISIPQTVVAIYSPLILSIYSTNPCKFKRKHF